MWLMFFITFCFALRSFTPALEIDDWFGIKISNGKGNINGGKVGAKRDKKYEKANENKKQTETIV